MPGNRRVTFDLLPRPSSSPALVNNNSAPLLPTPVLSIDELARQISILRAELRDGRLLQAKQRTQLNQELSYIAELTRKYNDVKQERQELKTKLILERDAAAATQKRLNVAVKNHAEAQDKCTRTMAECEGLRMVNEELSLLNKGLTFSRGEAKAKFDERVAEMESAFRDKLGAAEAAFMHELEETREELTNDRVIKTKALKKELDGRDAKIKRLEHDLNRQCEINAMFTLNYDRDTNFTKHLSMPPTIPVPGTSSSNLTSGSNKSQLMSPRRPLTHLENNNLTARKRSRAPSWREDKGIRSPSNLNKPSFNKGATNKSPGRDDQGRSHKRVRFSHPST
ncbi:hypothetical protein B0J17DRAFT_724692 [Rhizoctonia solani]|nr:hypothetical protein B0J17DRAFT_724692 [Rhizoctonia solani]